MADVYIEAQVDYLTHVWSAELKNFSSEKLREYARNLLELYNQSEDYKIWKLRNPLAVLLSDIFGPESESFKNAEYLNPIKLCERYWWNRCRKYYETRVISDKTVFKKLSDKILDEQEECDEDHFIEAALYHFQKLALKSSVKKQSNKLYAMRNKVKKHSQFKSSDLPKKLEPKEIVDISKDYFLLLFLTHVLQQPNQPKPFVRYFLDSVLSKNKYANLRLMFQLMLKCENVKIEPVRIRDDHFENMLKSDAALAVAIREGRKEIIQYLFGSIKDYFKGYSADKQRDQLSEYIERAFTCYLLWTSMEVDDKGLEQLFEIGFNEGLDVMKVVMSCIYFGKHLIRQITVKLNNGGRKELREYLEKEVKKYGVDSSDLIRPGDVDCKLMKGSIKARCEILFRKYLELAIKIQKLDMDSLLRPDSKSKRTVLHYAVAYNLDEGVELVLNLAESYGFCEATLLGPDIDGRTPAFLAVAGRRGNIINSVFKFYVNHDVPRKIYLDWDGSKSDEKQVTIPEVVFWRKY